MATSYPATARTELDIQKAKGSRSESIDFLRGLAIILVLFAHHKFVSYLNNMGWIGVDLFFVLSGFLVSSLLFTEYKLHGNIKPGLFLIRRGFKIYPLFYLSILLTFIQQMYFPHLYLFPDSQKLFLNDRGILIGLFIEAFFLQSYFFGFWGHHWSLSVEEFFYFSLTLLIFYLIKKNKIGNAKLFTRMTIGVFIICLVMRIVSNILMPNSILNFTAFHLRLDSLFSGVFISYLYNFRREELEYFYQANKKWFWISILPLISFTPFIDVLDSVFIKTIGFTLIFLSFDILLMTFLFERKICDRLKRLLGKFLFGAIVKIGIYSYGIYLFHLYIVRYVTGENYNNGWGIYSFLLYFFGAIILGIAMSRFVEIPMLHIRDRLFPKRSA